MTDEDLIIELSWRVDDELLDVNKHSQAKLYPSEVVTLGLAFAFNEVGSRACYLFGLSATSATCFRGCPNGRASMACSSGIGSGCCASWRSLP